MTADRSERGLPPWAAGWLAGDIRDPLHQPCEREVEWTTVNLAEAYSVVPTPLTYCMSGSTFDYGLRHALFRLGALRRRELPLSPLGSERIIGICFGRVAGNLSILRDMANRMPGTSAEALEQVYFGAATGAAKSTPVRSRYPAFILKAPSASVRARRQLLRLHADSHAWWRRSLATPLGGYEDSLELFFAAQRRFAAIFVPHTVASMLALGFYGPLREVAAEIGRPGLESAALRTGDTDESRTVADLWAVSRNGLTLDEFLAVHGYHGPAEGELESPSWRESDEPVRTLIETYRGISEDASPVAAQRRNAAERATAERELLSAVGPVRRAQVRAYLRLARSYVPLRELGRDAFLNAIDVARFAARAAGRQLHAAGELGDPSDIFYLRPEELLQLPGDATELVSHRRRRRVTYTGLDVPERWCGTPEPSAVTDQPAGTGLTGKGVSRGIVEGVVRVVTVQGSDELEPGEILVCRTTDPSWAAYFFVAAGVVIDIGGPLSHGAIVAREIGIPCVINVGNATRALASGDRIRIDGGTGRIDIIARAANLDSQRRFV